MTDINSRKFDSGNWRGCAWAGPEWSPYAEAIAANYRHQIPWYYNEIVDLGAVPSFQTTLTAPQQFDVLIMGAKGRSDFPFAQYLQITDDRTGIPWCTPNETPFAPLPAYGDTGVAPPTKFPEAFFLPAGARLRLDWSNVNPDSSNLTPASITFMGVQLINGRAPESVTMPNGATIPVGSRLPQFITIPMGQFVDAADDTFELTASQEIIKNLPPIDCGVEIHDAIMSFFFTFLGNVQDLMVKLNVEGDSRRTPAWCPVTSVYGRFGALYPSLPFSAPWLLPKGKRVAVSMLNNTATTLEYGLLTLRGVRLCEF